MSGYEPPRVRDMTVQEASAAWLREVADLEAELDHLRGLLRAVGVDAAQVQRLGSVSAGDNDQVGVRA